MMTDKLLVLQASLYVIIGAFTPVLALLTAQTPLTGRAIAGMIVGAIVGAATALKAFLSTTFSESKLSKPQ
jgi:carbon starvation protein CstA